MLSLYSRSETLGTGRTVDGLGTVDLERSQFVKWAKA